MHAKGLTAADLASYGISDVTEIVHNPDYDLLFKEETALAYRAMNAVPLPLWAPLPWIPVFLPAVPQG